jgi:hypothetical protein
MGEPMSEEKIREELNERGVSQDLADSSIAKAKAEWKPSV